MKNLLKNFLVVIVLATVVGMTAIGIYTALEGLFVAPTSVSEPPRQTAFEAPDKPGSGWSVKGPTETAEFISGPLMAELGELCVFSLNDRDTCADWIIVPSATCYVDSSGLSLAFSSNNRATYTILVAIVEDGQPKILTHVCEYGVQPGPEPNSKPNPGPGPVPLPTVTLKDWVSQNVPTAGKNKAAALASCYGSAASGIENGTIRSQEAAFSVIRTASQTKIDIDVWSAFLDGLAEKIVQKLGGSNDVKTLGAIFAEIAEGLKAVSEERLQTPDFMLQNIVTDIPVTGIESLKPDAWSLNASRNRSFNAGEYCDDTKMENEQLEF